jgi:hypothetical protein
LGWIDVTAACPVIYAVPSLERIVDSGQSVHVTKNQNEAAGAVFSYWQVYPARKLSV